MNKQITALLAILVATILLVGCKTAEGDKANNTSKAATETSKTVDTKTTTATSETPADPSPDTPTTTIEFSEMSHDFGDINEGDKVTHLFKFKNTGSEPLIISSAKGSCGCTVPEWPKEPIAPGGAGDIKVEFNSKNKPGNQTKTVTIQANTDPNPTRLTIKAQVAKDPNKPAADANANAKPQINLKQSN